MADNKVKFYPGKRVEVQVSLAHCSCWFRGTITEPRIAVAKRQGKVRVWLDQLPAGWITHEVIFSANDLFYEQLIRPINQPDRIITPLWELNSIFFFSAPVLVANGVQSGEGVVSKPPTDESPKIGVCFLKGEGEKEFPYDLLRIKRIHGRKYNPTSSSSLV